MNCIVILLAKRCQPTLWAAEAGMVLGRISPKFHQFIGKNDKWNKAGPYELVIHCMWATSGRRCNLR